MKKLALLAAITLLTFLSRCAPKIRTSLNDAPRAPLAADAPVLVLGTKEEEPVGALLVGSVHVGDNGGTVNCGFERMLSEVKAQARRAGANVVKLLDVTAPDMGSTCYRIEADMLFAKDLPTLQARLSRQEEAENKSRLPPGTPYALLYVYRPASIGGAVSGFDLHLNDSIIYRARQDSRTVIKLTRPGAVTLWAENGPRPLTLQVEPGQEYFLQCAFVLVNFKARPWLDFVSTRRGRLEYEQTSGTP